MSKYRHCSRDFLEAVVDKMGGKEAAEQFLRGELALVPTAPLDTIVRVDRSVRPLYPNRTGEVLHPELETVGPAEYDLTEVELYLHDEQKSGGWMNGSKLYKYLKDTGSLKSCLGLHDALSIQKKGIKVFQSVFVGKEIFCWKSIIRSRGGRRQIPYVYDDGHEVVVNWRWIGSGWYNVHPAARL